MKCQEVIELMQRYLDQDLDETEYNQMLGHIQTCPDCTELFERLVSLSHELEQLPKVTPAYSLVDAILPKLQQIDAGVPIEDTGMSSGITAPLAAGATPSTAQAKQAASEFAGRRRRPRGLVSTRIVGGVVAAGLVLGFFVFQLQEQQNSMKNADELLLPSGSSQQSTAAGSGNKATAPETKAETFAGAADADSGSPANKSANEAASDNAGGSNANPAAPVQQEQAPASAQVPVQKNTAPQGVKPQAKEPAGTAASQGTQPRTQEPADTAAPSNNTEAVTEAPAASDKPGQAESVLRQNQTEAGETASDTAPRAGTEAAEKQPSSPAAPPVNGYTPVPEQPASPDSNASSDAASSSADTAPEMALRLAPPDQPKAGITGGNPDLKAKDHSGGAAGTGISSITTVPSDVLPSPDGTYTATVNMEKRVVVITDKQGKAVYTSTRTAANTESITLVKWESASRLEYQISSASAAATYVINVTDKTETKK